MARSLLFAASYTVYLALVMAPFQQVVLRPLAALLPSRRGALLRSWLLLQARVVLALARWLADVRVAVAGAIEPTGCIVVMNHQSVLDIPLGVSLVRGPYPLIPTRASYRRGIPGISTLVRMSGYPLVSQGRVAARAEVAALAAAADRVASGERSFLIFPEGHRTRTGEIQPFMSSGLRLILRRARRRPVYVVVVDGLWHLRTFRDTASRLAGTRARVVVRGPYTIPADDFQMRDFIGLLRERMVETLAELRRPGAEPAPRAASPRLAR